MIKFFAQRKKLIIALIIIAIIITIVFPKLGIGKSNKKVESAIVKSGNLEEKLTISGTTDADEKVTLRFQTTGRLAWVGVREGDYVKKYQGIASLDQRELKKDLEKYLNDYLTKRWDFDQVKKDDYKDKVITDTIKRIQDKAQFAMNKSVLDVELQDISIQYANLWTPIEGIVTRATFPYPGVNLTALNTAEFDIVNPQTVYFSANADQTEVTKLYDGLNGKLILDAYPDKTITGSIKSISFIPKTGETGTVYAVKFIFVEDNANYQYRIGMGGDLTFVTDEKNDVLYLPVKFVKSENGKKYVKVKKNSKEEKVYMTTGMETDNDIEIVSGLTEGTTVYD